MEEKKTKVCTMCNRELTLDNFSKKKAAKDGLQYRCKECQKKENKANYAKKKTEDSLKKIEAVSSDGAVMNMTKMYSDSELSKFTPRALMRELAARGYIGRLEYIERRVIDITKM